MRTWTSTALLVFSIVSQRTVRCGTPPIVAELPEGDRFLLLDGANRVSAIENLDIPHILVQVERYSNPSLQFRHWNPRRA